jgi:hypothetical protein
MSDWMTVERAQAERRAAPKPARIPAGDRRTYPFVEGSS